MTDIRVRSDKPQTDGFGNTWRKGGTHKLPADQAAALLAIPDGGFTAVDDNDIETDVLATGLPMVEQPNASAFAVTVPADGDGALIAAGAVVTDADRPPHATTTNSGVPVREPVFVQTSPAGEGPAAAPAAAPTVNVPAGDRKTSAAKGDGRAKPARKD